MKLMVLMIFLWVTVSAAPNAQLMQMGYSGYGRNVDTEEVLEAALMNALRSHGVYDVDVDLDDSGFRRNVLEVEVYSMSSLPVGFAQTLQNAFQADLGVTGVTVVPDNRGRHRWESLFGNKEWFYVQFNPMTLNQRLNSLARDFPAAPAINFSQEDFLWD